MRPAGVTALAIFFALATLISFTAALSLASPDSALDRIWDLNPVAREALQPAGMWGALLLLAVSAACGLAAFGLWTLRAWGRRVGIGVLVVSMVGAFGNVFFRGDLRALVGLPVAGILTAYLMNDRAKPSRSSRS